MTIWVYTGGRPSNGAKALSALNGFNRARTGRGIKLRDVLINWGNSNPIELQRLERVAGRILNAPAVVAKATNKLTAFQAFAEAGAAAVQFTTNQAIAQRWADGGKKVVVRNKLTGHSGDGIVIIDAGGRVPKAPLYTLYCPKNREYRVHVVKGRVIDTQRKIRDPAREPACWQVRSHANGFIFARDNIDADPRRDALAVAATAALGLDFGAVDILYDKELGPLLLEVNTAPGLEGQTVQNYERAFRACEA